MREWGRSSARVMVVLAVGGSPTSWAQSHDEAAHAPLTEVTITARPDTSRPLLAPALQLSGAALTQKQGSTLGETLDNLPGVANSSFGPNVGRPVIRGLEGDRVRLLQNGGANMDVSGLSFDHAVPIDPLATERIEVLYGPATLLYGSSAVGGVVNVIDNRIARERAFDAQGGVMGKAEVRAGGAANERSTGAMVEAGNDRFALHVDALDRNTANLRVPKQMDCTLNGTTTTQRRVCNSASSTQGAGVGGTLLFDQGYLGLSTSEYRSNYGTVAEPDVTIGMLRRHTVMEGEWRALGQALQALKFQWGQTNYTHTEYPGAEVGTRFDNAGHALRVEARQQPQSVGHGLQLDGVLGLQRDANRLSAQGAEAFVPSSRTHSAALFTYQALKTSWGQVSAALRSESVVVASLDNADPTRFPSEEKRFNPRSVALGALRNFRQGEAPTGWQLSSHLSWNQRAPKDYELFANGPHAATGTYEQGDRRSAMEKATQFDLGGAWKDGAHSAGVTGFVTHFDNYLSLQPTGEFKDNTGTLVNAAAGSPVYQYEGVRARLVGVESTAKLRMVGGSQALWSPNAAHGVMDLELRADRVRADDLTYNRPLPRIAPTRLGADWVWSHAAWGARVGLLHAGAQQRVPHPGDVTTASYTLLNAAVNYHTHTGATHWMMFAKFDNLTNKLAYSSTSVLTQTMGSHAPPLAGRSVKVGLQASF